MRARLGGPVHPLSPGARGQHCRGPAGPIPGLNLPRTPSSHPAGPAASRVLLQKKAQGACGWQLSRGGESAGWEEAPSPWGGQGPVAAPAHSPRKGTPACLASSSPPPLEKTLVHSWDTDTGSTSILCSQGAGGVGGSWPPMPAIAQDSPSSGGRQSRSCSPRARSPAAPPSCRRSAPASRPPRTPPGDRERGRGSRWVPRKQPRWVRRTGQSVCPGAKAPVWEQYLGRGDHEGPQGAVGAQGVHHGHVLIRGPRGRVHKQVVQLPPGHIGHKLLYQRCGDPGRLRVGGSRRAGRVSLGPRSPQGRATFGPGPTCIRRAVCATVRQEQGETLPQHPQDFCSGPRFDGWSGDPPRADVCAPERWPVGNARQAWPGSSPHPGPAPTPGSPALALGGSRTLSAEAEAPEPAQVPHRAPSCPGEDQAAEGLMAAAHALAPQANCLRTCRLDGSGLGGASWK